MHKVASFFKKFFIFILILIFLYVTFFVLVENTKFFCEVVFNGQFRDFKDRHKEGGRCLMCDDLGHCPDF
jgi:hypothetical protein